MQVSPVPGVMIFRFQAPLCFVNSGVFRARLEIACNVYKKINVDEHNGCIKQLFLMVGELSKIQVLSNKWNEIRGGNERRERTERGK